MVDGSVALLRARCSVLSLLSQLTWFADGLSHCFPSSLFPRPAAGIAFSGTSSPSGNRPSKWDCCRCWNG
jgi:hypothetical protein